MATTKVPHYMVGTKVSKMRESYNKEHFMKTFLKISWEETLSGNRIESSATKANKKTTGYQVNQKIRNADFEKKIFPLVDSHIHEVELILKNRKMYNFDDLLVDKREPDNNLSREDSKDIKFFNERRTDKQIEIQDSLPKLQSISDLSLPVIARVRQEGVVKEEVTNQVTSEMDIPNETVVYEILRRPRKKKDRFQCSPKPAFERKLCSLNREDFNRQSFRKSFETIPTRTKSSVSYSLSNLMEINSATSIKFPAILNNTAKLNSAQSRVKRTPGILPSFPVGRCRERQEHDEGVVRASSPQSHHRTASSLSEGNRRQDLKQSRDDRLKVSNHRITNVHLRSDGSSAGKWSGERNWRIRKMKTSGDDDDDDDVYEGQLTVDIPTEFQIQRLLGFEHSIVRRGPDKPHNPVKRNLHNPNRHSSLLPLKKLSVHDKYKPRPHKASKQTAHKYLQQRTGQLQQSVWNRLSTSKCDRRPHKQCSTNHREEQTESEEDRWKRSRIREWLLRVNEVAEHPPSSDVIKDEIPQTAFLVVHQGEESD